MVVAEPAQVYLLARYSCRVEKNVKDSDGSEAFGTHPYSVVIPARNIKYLLASF